MSILVSTIQASFLNKKLNIETDEKNCRVNLNVWDTAGQEIFHSLGSIYYRNANGAILVYDVSSPESFSKIKMWITELKKIVGDDIVCVIVGNKKDLLKDNKVQYDPEPHLQYANSVGAFHLLTSAKLNENIDEVFLEISKKMIKAFDEKQATSATLNRSNSMRRQLRVEDSNSTSDDETSNSSSRCCGR